MEKNYESELCGSQNINNPKFRSRGLCKMSDFTPDSNRDVHLDVYLKAVEHEILNSKSRRVKSNLKKERDAIKELRRNKDIVIFQADKGGAVVIQNRADYIEEAKWHLNLKDADGTPVYQSLQNPQIQDFNKRVQDAMDLATSNGVIEEEMSEIRFIEDPKIGNLYFLPKIHKKKTSPPGRPVCNTRGTMTENVSKWTDLELQPLVKKCLHISKILLISSRNLKRLTNHIIYRKILCLLLGT